MADERLRHLRQPAAGAVRTAIPPDTAICADCLAELFDPADRRYRYAFINCTHCGPRYTITRALPYDRAQTSMARVRAVPAVPARVHRSRRTGASMPSPMPARPAARALALSTRVACAIAGDPIAATLARLRAGDIVAIKGLGGFHLACDARNASAVARCASASSARRSPSR